MYNKNIEYVEEKFQMYCTKYLGVKALSNSRKRKCFSSYFYLNVPLMLVLGIIYFFQKVLKWNKDNKICSPKKYTFKSKVI